MIEVRFVSVDGTITTASGRKGARLLDIAQEAGQPLEGTCNGDMACATCHVLVDAVDFDRLPVATEEEEQLLDLVPDSTRFSRLACQIHLLADLESITVRVP